jgi:chromosome segregation ATPase
LEALVTSHADELLETKQQHSIVMQEMQNTVDSLMASHARIQSAQAADIERARAETLSIQAEAVALKEQISELDLQLVQAQDLQASTASERQQALAEVSELKSALAACQQEYSECQARADALIVQLNEKLAAAEARAESEARARALVDAELRAQADSLQALMEMSKVINHHDLFSGD